MKKILFLLFLLNIFKVYAEEIKLNCYINFERRYSNGNVRKENYNATTIVTIFQNTKFIQVVTSNPIFSAINQNSDTVTSSYDRSDENAWVIGNVFQLSGMKITSDIRIDRNTGIINFTSKNEESDFSSVDVGSGECKKIDTRNRRF